MTEEDYHKVKAEIAMARFQGADNPFTGEVDKYGVKLRRRGYFEIANEITDEEVRARLLGEARRERRLLPDLAAVPRKRNRRQTERIIEA